MNKKNTETDWTSYYQQKKSRFSTYTQRYTLEKILSILARYVPGLQLDILELGGANSCFVEEVCDNNANIKRYDIIDNNELGVDLFSKKNLKTVSHKGILANLTETVEFGQQYDFVYSIGLIEHFNKADRDKVIAAHFQSCKDNGIVMISFPTPTLKYRFVRRCMELIGVWRFWDEHPLQYDDVKEILEEKGIVQKVEINKKLPLTQMITVIKKKSEST